MSHSAEEKNRISEALIGAGQQLIDMTREDLAAIAEQLSKSLDVEKLERLAKLARKAQGDKGLSAFSTGRRRSAFRSGSFLLDAAATKSVLLESLPPTNE